MMIRRESSAETAARFLDLKRNRRRRARESTNRLRRLVVTAEPPRVSGARVVLPVTLACLAVWVPDAPIARALAAQPLARIEWPAMPFESNADRLRRLRLAAVADGRCYTCRCQPVRSGARYCDECIGTSRDYRRSIAYQKCPNCGAPLNGRRALLCVACMRKSADRFRVRVADRVAGGTCGRCGKNSLSPGASQCVGCLDDMRDRMLSISREAGSKPKVCPICRDLGIGGTGHDSRTHDRWMERRKAWAPESK